MMKVRSTKPKPPVGMELTLTLSMPLGASVEDSSLALLEFFRGTHDMTAKTRACWSRIHCRGIPKELEARLAIVVDNDPHLSK